MRRDLTVGEQEAIRDFPEAMAHLRALLEENEQLRLVAREQWEAAHYERCARIGNDGRCTMGDLCAWPRPQVLADASQEKNP